MKLAKTLFFIMGWPFMVFGTMLYVIFSVTTAVFSAILDIWAE